MTYSDNCMKLINLYQKFYTPKGLNKKYMAVDNYLFRGPHPKISDLIELKNSGVNQIYDFRHVSVRGFKFVERYFCKELGIKYIRFPFSHLTGRFPTQKEFDFIANCVKVNGENGGKTLFHCNSGSHRTAHMAAYYDLTKGEPISKVFSNTNIIDYVQRVEDVVNKHFYQHKYFNRHYKSENPWNPIMYFRNKFNNRVKTATEKAQASFLAIVTRYRNW